MPSPAAAFSPDGSRLAVQLGQALHIINLADGSDRKLTDLGSRRRLAGTGAWLPDNSSLAILDLLGCQTDCDKRALDARTWRVRYLDAARGVEVPGPRLDDVRGIGVRLLGWQHSGDTGTGPARRQRVHPGWTSARRRGRHR